MGRYDFRPSRVLRTATQALHQGRIKQEPPWAWAVSQNTPPHILVRSQPVQHSGYPRPKPGRKAKSLYRPQKITYPEDAMRNVFFQHHPWELARPRIVQEGRTLDGGERWDSVRPEGLGLQPENVVRRQLWLIEREGHAPQAAYDIARREFYQQRMRQDIERKVAKEEAMHVGAYFDKSTIAWGMELEDRKFYGFKEWATRRVATMENNRQALVMGVDARNAGTEAVEELVASPGVVGEEEVVAAAT